MALTKLTEQKSGLAQITYIDIMHLKLFVAIVSMYYKQGMHFECNDFSLMFTAS